MFSVSRALKNLSSRCLTTNTLPSLKSALLEAESKRIKVPEGFEPPKTHQPNPNLLPTNNQLRPIYLDLQATTPLDPRVLDAMLPYMTALYGNPHSRTHSYGWEAEKAVETARAQVARLIRAADPKEVIFTSGATESNNLAIKGVARFARKADPRRNHIITTATEHKCVLDSMRWLGEEEGFEVTYLPVGSDGLVCVEDLKAALRPESTCLVSIMAVNNEIGVVQPMASLGAAIKASNPAIYFHTDAAQAVGKLPELDVNAWHVDCMSVSGHKLYGPKGIGALYVRRRPRVRLEPLISGGGQERGLRSGTVPAPLAVGLGAACDIASQEVLRDHQHISKLSRRLVDGILQHIPSVTRNGSTHHYYPGCVNLSFACVEGESLLMSLKAMALSSGSACTSASLEPSYVLRALGAEDDMAHSSIRFGLGRFTTESEVDFCIAETVQHVKRLRDLSPLWEMVQEGIDLKSIQWSQH